MRKTYKKLLIFLALVLMLLPLAGSFNDWLTKIVEATGIYRPLETYIVPYVIKLVLAVLKLLGIKTLWGETMFIAYKGGEQLAIRVSWNCLGWQSLVLLAITLITGLVGKYTWKSKLECVIVGLLGTFLMNLLRIVLFVLAIIYVNPKFGYMLHDYIMVLFTVAWLFIFWWFAYNFVLEEKK